MASSGTIIAIGAGALALYFFSQRTGAEVGGDGGLGGGGLGGGGGGTPWTPLDPPRFSGGLWGSSSGAGTPGDTTPAYAPNNPELGTFPAQDVIYNQQSHMLTLAGGLNEGATPLGRKAARFNEFSTPNERPDGVKDSNVFNPGSKSTTTDITNTTPDKAPDREANVPVPDTRNTLFPKVEDFLNDNFATLAIGVPSATAAAGFGYRAIKNARATPPEAPIGLRGFAEAPTTKLPPIQETAAFERPPIRPAPAESLDIVRTGGAAVEETAVFRGAQVGKLLPGGALVKGALALGLGAALLGTFQGPVGAPRSAPPPESKPTPRDDITGQPVARVFGPPAPAKGIFKDPNVRNQGQAIPTPPPLPVNASGTTRVMGPPTPVAPHNDRYDYRSRYGA